jgi:hypothetical protein
MGWAVGYDEKWKRDVGYGVPSVCDHPDCEAEIDRGLAYVCGGGPYGGGLGCGLYFCDKHLTYDFGCDADEIPQLCERCLAGDGGRPFTPKPDTQAWLNHKENDPSWAEWRAKKTEASV